MHQISEIEKLSSGRYYITLDDGLQFPLYGKEMGKYGIEVNEVRGGISGDHAGAAACPCEEEGTASS